MGILKNLFGGQGYREEGTVRRLTRRFTEEVFGAVDRKYRKIRDSLLSTFGYATNADVYAIISFIANKMVEIPTSVYELNLKREYEETTDNDFYNLLFKDPSETYEEKLRKIAINLCITGDVFILKKYGSDETFPEALEVVKSSEVQIQCDSHGNISTVDYYKNGMYFPTPYSQFIHLMDYDPTPNNDCKGLSPLQAGFKVLDASNDIQTASSRLFKNLGSSILVTDKDGSIDDTGEAKKIQKAINARLGGAERAGQVTVVSGDYDVHNLGLTSKDLELVKSQPVKLRQLCSVYGLDSASFNDPDNKIYNNRKEAEKSNINNAVKPRYQRILSLLNKEIGSLRNSKIEANYSALECLQEDQKQEAEKNTIISDGVRDVLRDTIENSQKIHILHTVWKYSEEDAKNLVNGKG